MPSEEINLLKAILKEVKAIRRAVDPTADGSEPPEITRKVDARRMYKN